MNKRLNPYIAYVGDPSGGAVLVFAQTARAARMPAYRALSDWFDLDYIKVRVSRIRDDVGYWKLYQQGDKPHAVDNLPTCNWCRYSTAPIESYGYRTFCSKRKTLIARASCHLIREVIEAGVPFSANRLDEADIIARGDE